MGRLLRYLSVTVFFATIATFPEPSSADPGCDEVMVENCSYLSLHYDGFEFSGCGLPCYYIQSCCVQWCDEQFPGGACSGGSGQCICT